MVSKHAAKGGATQKQRDALRIKVERAKSENNHVMQRYDGRRAPSNVGMRLNDGLPSISEAPVGARVVECRGSFAVALAHQGVFLGLFKKEDS